MKHGSQRGATAHHEAGHAIAAVMRGRGTLTSVTLDADRHGEGLTWSRAKPADLAFISSRRFSMAEHRYLRDPGSFGYQPPERASSKRPGAGSLRFHAIGCRVDGGAGLRAGVCQKCDDHVVDQYYRQLMRLDRRAA